MSSNTQNKPRNNSHSGNRNNNNQQRRNNQNRNNNNRRGVPPRRNKPVAVKLTWWQKFLKAIGLYKEPTKQQRSKSNHTAKKETSNAAKKTAKKKAPRPAPPQKVESSRLYVGNLSYEVTESELVELFKGFGSVKNAEVVYNKRTQRSKGFAFVEMMNVDDAKRASEVLHEQPFMGRNMIVNGARTEEERPSADAPAA